MLSHITYSYKLTATGIDFSEAPIGLQSRYYFRNSHSHHVFRSLASLGAESEWYEREGEFWYMDMFIIH